MRDRQPCVYILASGHYGTLYTGVTSALLGRIHQHREEITVGFSARYGVKRLVYYEMYEDMATAIAREKTVKKWPRQWKINLIEERNPTWADLAVGFGFEPLG